MNDLVKRRRRWTEELKREIVRESYDPATSLQSVAARHDVNPSQLSHWRKRYRDRIVAQMRHAEDADTGAAQRE